MDGPKSDDSGRSKGRPPRGSKELGRDRLIESTRDAMRVKPRIDIQRREIAEHAGVTPALVSYYFPDKSHLLEAAAQPVIDSCAADMRRILRSPTTLRDRLKRLISLFLAFNKEQGFILDHYLELSYSRKQSEALGVLSGVKHELSSFFGELVASGLVKGDDPAFVHAALWGLCRHLGRGGSKDVFQIDDDLRESPEDLARKIFSLISG